MTRTLLVVALAVALRLALVPLGLYRSTDFEVHRNWLALTHSLPLSRWYFEETSQWTLDYPPLFAYFEWALSQVAAHVDPAMLRVDNLEYASPATVVFQRVSVAAGDLLLLAGALRAGAGLGSACGPRRPAWTAAVALFTPGLLIVDHIHFQYNGMMLGILLLSAADLEDGRVYRGSALFCVLLCMKQIFLYVAPVYFVYLLRAHCGLAIMEGGGPTTVQLRLPKLMGLAAVVLGTFALAWAPIVQTGQVLQAASRLFPFGRGLTHAYWAPNLWALYNTADRVLARLGFGDQHGHSSTAGFAEVYESSALWTVPPKATFALTLLAYMPLLSLIWRQTKPGGVAAPGTFTLHAALGSAVSFSCGWHVHEKAILMVTVPLLAAAVRKGDGALIQAAAALSAVGTFSVLPLLPPGGLETPLKYGLLLGGHALELVLLRGCTADGERRGLLSMLKVWPLPGALVALGLAALAFYCDFGGHRRLFGNRMEFLPLLLTSDVCAVLVLGSLVHLHVLAAAAPDVKEKKRA